MDKKGKTSIRSKEKFWTKFFCEYLANHPESSQLVELEVDNRTLRFKDIARISEIYHTFRGKKYDKDLIPKMKDNFNQIIRYFVRIKLLEEGSSYSTETGKRCRKHKIIDGDLWNALRRKYSPLRVKYKPLLVGHTETRSEESSSYGGDGENVGLNDDEICDLSLPGFDSYFDQHYSDGQSIVERSEGYTTLTELYSDSGVDSFRGADDQSCHDADPSSIEGLLSGFGETIGLSFTIVPDCCGIKGGCTFVILASGNLKSGIYYVKFTNYGTREAKGEGGNMLQGLSKIPGAVRSGTHCINVDIMDAETNDMVGNTTLQYRDSDADNKLVAVSHTKIIE